MLNVCENCAKFGKVVADVREKKYIEKIQKKKQKEKKAKPLISEDELIQSVVGDFSKIIKEKRESLGLKQEDFAKKINEKVSLIHKIETDNFEPSLSLARKIEKFLRVKLIEQRSSDVGHIEKTKSEAFTLGDFVKVKKR